VGRLITVLQDTGMDLMDTIVRHLEDYNRHITSLLAHETSFEAFIAERNSIFARVQRALDDLEDTVQSRQRQLEHFVYLHRDVIREQRWMSANVSSVSKRSWQSVVAWLSFFKPSEADYLGKVKNCVTSLVRGEYELELVLASIVKMRNRILEGKGSRHGVTPFERDSEYLDARWEDLLEIRLCEGRQEIESWRSTRHREREAIFEVLEGPDSNS
jgi:hypothetical protein